MTTNRIDGPDRPSAVLPRPPDEELRKAQIAEAQLAEAQEIAHIGSWDWDVRADSVTWSDELYRIFGMEPGEFAATYRAFLERVHPEDRGAVESAVTEVLHTGGGFSFDHRIVRPDDTIRVLHATGRAVAGEDGEIVRMAGTGHDITERTRADEALRESERRHRQLFDDNPHPMWVYDVETLRFLGVNDAAIHHYGYTREEFLAMRLEEIRPPEDVPLLYENLARRAGKIDASGSWRHWKRDHTVIDVEIVSHDIDWSGRAARLVLVTDVTERRRAQEALHRRNAELEALHETALALIERLDPTRLLEDIVARAAALVGTSHGYLYTLEPSGEEMVSRVGTGLMGGSWLGMRIRRGEGLAGRVWDRGTTTTVDDYHSWTGRRREFDQLPLRAVAGVPLRSDGQVVGVIGVVHIDRDQRFSQEQLALLERFGELASLALHNARLYEREREAAARLRALDEMKNGFLEAVSHELRTPLTSVLGYALTLARPDLEASPVERSEMLQVLINNARKLDRLLGDLLDLDRLVRGVVEPHRRPTDLRALVERVLAEADVGDHPVEVEVPEMRASIDSAKVERIVENLVVNSVRHTPPGTQMWVRAWRHGDAVVLAVEDGGPGVPPLEREWIFQPFRRGSSAPSHSPSTGIGLSLVARFAELHGGRAWIQDRAGGGVSFRVELPGAVVPAEPSPAAS